MPEKIKVIIWGTGSASEKVMEIIDEEKVEVVAYIDNNPEKQGKYINEIKIISPIDLEYYYYDYIIIGSSFFDEIYKQLLEMNVSKEKIVKILNKKTMTSKELVKSLSEENIAYMNIVKDKYLKRYFNNYAVCNMNVMSADRNIKLYKYKDYLIKGLDYVRVSSLELMANEIKERQIEGNVAELGVYKGDFSKIICDYFTNRKIYLFDTFEGFAEEDIKMEQESNFSKASVGHLHDTNVELVMSKVNYNQNVIIKKGYFPDTAKDITDERFAFVSIDTDLYKPTYEGLNFFYDRLNKGGYILIHDYNHNTYTGVKEAVRQFCSERGINYFPLSDYYGSVVILK